MYANFFRPPLASSCERFVNSSSLSGFFCTRRTGTRHTFSIYSLMLRIESCESGLHDIQSHGSNLGETQPPGSEVSMCTDVLVFSEQMSSPQFYNISSSLLSLLDEYGLRLCPIMHVGVFSLSCAQMSGRHFVSALILKPI